jgi:hypothetical protein
VKIGEYFFRLSHHKFFHNQTTALGGLF